MKELSSKSVKKWSIKKWEASKEVKKWKIDNGVKDAMIAGIAGVSVSLVRMTVNGYRRSQAVIDAFVSRGCPREFFEVVKPELIQ